VLIVVGGLPPWGGVSAGPSDLMIALSADGEDGVVLVLLVCATAAGETASTSVERTAQQQPAAREMAGFMALIYRSRRTNALILWSNSSEKACLSS
jgi:hypothetical protein